MEFPTLMGSGTRRMGFVVDVTRASLGKYIRVGTYLTQFWTRRTEDSKHIDVFPDPQRKNVASDVFSCYFLDALEPRHSSNA